MLEATSTAPLSYISNAFFFDFDGTLVELQPRPEMVEASPELISHLEQLGHLTEGALAIVTGRQIEVVDAALAPLRFAAAGIHGLEMRLSAGDDVWKIADGGPLDALRPMAEAWVAARPGLLLEDKGASLALHYRARPELATEVAAYAESLCGTHPAQLAVQHGKMVAELRSAGPTKGDAVRMLMKGPAFEGRIPVFFGDDITDEGAFAVAQELGGLGVFVGAAAQKTCARARLESSAALRRILSRLARREPVLLQPGSDPGGDAESSQGQASR